jgi:murein DD-endopeptidase MepM/ murein hydrolase activator NlpD
MSTARVEMHLLRPRTMEASVSPQPEVSPVPNLRNLRSLRSLRSLPDLPDLRNLRSPFKRLLSTARPGFAVIRHRVQSHPHSRRLRLAAVAVVVALAGGAAAAHAAGPDGTPDQTSAGYGSEAADRGAAAERPDRSQRDGDGGGESSESEGKSGASKKNQQKSKDKSKKRKKKKKAKDWVHPMPGARTTSCYGARWGSSHKGVDLAAAQGTPIRAVGAGRVIGAGWLYTGYGKSVVIDHGGGFLTHYAHASKVKVSAGQKVKPGQKIALEGSTGNSTGPHLHLEVHKGLWNQIEPTKWLRRHGVKVGGC